MANIINARDIPSEDNIFVKKDVFGYRIVNPIKNQDGSINWINLLVGGWRNFLMILAIFALIYFFMFTYKNDMQEMKDYYENRTCAGYDNIIEDMNPVNSDTLELSNEINFKDD